MELEENEQATQQQREKFRQTCEAYVKLFGPVGEPTPYGRLVLEDLNRFCRTFDESVHFDAQRRMDPYTTVYRDGKKAVALRIRAMLEWSGYVDSNPGT